MLEDDGGDSLGLALGVVGELDDLDGADGGDHQFLQGKGSVSYDSRAATEIMYLTHPDGILLDIERQVADNNLQRLTRRLLLLSHLVVDHGHSRSPRVGYCTSIPRSSSSLLLLSTTSRGRSRTVGSGSPGGGSSSGTSSSSSSTFGSSGDDLCKQVTGGRRLIRTSVVIDDVAWTSRGELERVEESIAKRGKGPPDRV